MRITKGDILKTVIWISICAIIGFATLGSIGCTSLPVEKTKYVVPELDNSIYTSCPRPTEVLEDYGVGVKEQLIGKSEAEIDALTLKAYGNTKQDHIACYKTVVNIKEAYEKLKLSLGE